MKIEIDTDDMGIEQIRVALVLLVALMNATEKMARDDAAKNQPSKHLLATVAHAQRIASETGLADHVAAERP